ncbi:nuclear transport factor 2 family protein [Streptomyces sp. NBC_00988]|uniref:nuclear transport factor 2 family protein n=1 Tax=Streptomyces sp. NBC_00988 TaxID=2903704 RepID=UPI003866D87F|nr:nuclear transport factor 2 family protein [Streptomyces sp. NBC_00988]
MTEPTTTVEQRLAKLEAVHQIQNLMGRYSFWHTANMHRECLELFAMKTPDVRAEMVWGVYEGPGSIDRLYPGFHTWTDGDAKGKMHMHTITTPVIEVADDLRTAKGVWVSPGHETLSFSLGSNEPPDDAFWAWCKYGCDFILEDGVWKIWHLHVYPIFMSPYGTSWVEAATQEQPDVQLPPEYLPDREPTGTAELSRYHPDRPYVNVPAPPDPYPTFDEGAAY